MKNKKIITVILAAVAVIGIAAFIIFSGKGSSQKQVSTLDKTNSTEPKADPYKGPNVIKQTVKLKNIPRFRKIIEKQEKEKSSLRRPGANNKEAKPAVIAEETVTIKKK